MAIKTNENFTPFSNSVTFRKPRWTDLVTTSELVPGFCPVKVKCPDPGVDSHNQKPDREDSFRHQIPAPCPHYPLTGFTCLVPRPHYYARPVRFGPRGPRKFLRPRQTRRSETFCLTWGGAFGSGRAVNNLSAMMKDVQQPRRVQRINRAFLFYLKVLWPFLFIYLIKLIWTLSHLKNYL